MSKHEKLLASLCSKPKDYTWSELVALLQSFGIELSTGSGSVRKFRNPLTGKLFHIHQPHPSNILKRYQVLGAIDFLRQEGFLG